ncbi:uncharacterized protein LOC113238863 [Hyposmocoma kahamanoa]|uniref:uncharacterized protein LOC113238863 n=1 Tax=Hyposmocoma kahamanoa TaxID=1477025 RepID=UPI000E6DA3DF|nr:uncharacterized protein LOC113238863 [Hyposmocoma kahamanoa]
MNITEDPLYLEIAEIVNGFNARYLERVEKVQQEAKACKKNNVLQSKIAQEQKLNAELKSRLAELSKRNDGIEKICLKFSSGLTISDSDQQRLENAKEMVEIGKMLTGIRFDYSAPPDVVKGYIKCERNRTLTPLELPAAEAEARLWAMLGDCAAQNDGKENRRDN